MSPTYLSPVQPTTTETGHLRWSVPTLFLTAIGVFLVTHPYHGLIHDARLYTLLALDSLHPDLYGNDVFLKYGSQGAFTLFSPLYAWLVSLFDVETAASLIIGFSTAMFLVAAWWLARSLMVARLAWLAVGLIVALPGTYGSKLTFNILEQFVTPRLLAEGLVLFSIAAWMRERRILAAGLLLLGLLAHPIMTFPGFVLLLAMGWGLKYWRSCTITVIVASIVAGAALLDWLPIARWQFDPEWQAVVGNGSYLRLVNWSLQEWASVARVLATLGCAALCLNAISRRLAIGMIVTCCALLLLSWIGGDLLQLTLVMQGQAWRVLWLATVIAILLLPSIAFATWKGPTLHRCGLLMLATSWMIEEKSITPVFATLGMVAIGCANLHLPERQTRIALFVASLLSLVVLVCSLAVAWTDLTLSGGLTNDPDWLEKLRAASMNGLLPCVALLGVWHAATRIRSRAGLALLALTVLMPVALIASSAVKPWKSHVYTADVKRSLAAWRAHIPPGTDVVWAADLLPLSDPLGAWLLLERPSYYSTVQATSGLFSRAAALEVRRRAHAIPISLPVEYPYRIIATGPAGLGPRCGEIPARYIVTQVLIPDARMIPAPPDVGPPFNKLKLYICP